MFGRFAQPVTLRFSEIKRIERQDPPRLLDFGIRIRFRVESLDTDRIQFTGFSAPMKNVLGIFQARGITIQQLSWRTWVKDVR
jgi:hypothetical protein